MDANDPERPIDDSLSGYPLQRVDAPWRSVRGERDDSPDIVQRGLQALRTLGEFPRDAASPHAVDPTLQHRRLRAPPCGVDEHQRFAPTQFIEILGEMRFGVRRFDVISLLVNGQPCVEVLVVQIANPNLMLRRPQSTHDMIE